MKIRNGFVSNSSSSSFVIVTNNKTMCNKNIPSVNLQTAVLMQIQEFVQSGQAFSRYDITKALRQKCNDGLLEIPEVEDTNPGAANRFNVRKNDVDGIFEQLYRNCLANGLPPLNYSFNQAGGYREFKVDSQAFSNSLVSVPPTSPNVAPVSSVATATAASPVVNSNTTLSDSEIRRRVTQYMDSCRKIGKVPTLKQVQSAIKRGDRSTGLSYREIFNIVSSLGYKI